MATRTLSVAGGNWNTPATWIENFVPTLADDVVCNASSGNLTIDIAAACLTLDQNGYTGTITLNNPNSLTIHGAGQPITNPAADSIQGTGDLIFQNAVDFDTPNVNLDLRNLDYVICQSTAAFEQIWIGDTITFNGYSGFVQGNGTFTAKFNAGGGPGNFPNGTAEFNNTDGGCTGTIGNIQVNYCTVSSVQAPSGNIGLTGSSGNVAIYTGANDNSNVVGNDKDYCTSTLPGNPTGTRNVSNVTGTQYSPGLPGANVSFANCIITLNYGSGETYNLYTNSTVNTDENFEFRGQLTGSAINGKAVIRVTSTNYDDFTGATFNDGVKFYLDPGFTPGVGEDLDLSGVTIYADLPSSELFQLLGVSSSQRLRVTGNFTAGLVLALTDVRNCYVLSSTHSGTPTLLASTSWGNVDGGSNSGWDFSSRPSFSHNVLVGTAQETLEGVL